MLPTKAGGLPLIIGNDQLPYLACEHRDNGHCHPCNMTISRLWNRKHTVKADAANFESFKSLKELQTVFNSTKM